MEMATPLFRNNMNSNGNNPVKIKVVRIFIPLLLPWKNPMGMPVAIYEAIALICVMALFLNGDFFNKT